MPRCTMAYLGGRRRTATPSPTGRRPTPSGGPLRGPARHARGLPPSAGGSRSAGPPRRARRLWPRRLTCRRWRSRASRRRGEKKALNSTPKSSPTCKQQCRCEPACRHEVTRGPRAPCEPACCHEVTRGVRRVAAARRPSDTPGGCWSLVPPSRPGQ